MNQNTSLYIITFIYFLVVYCGPTEWRFERRRGSSSERKNTVRHLIQMMSISESGEEPEDEDDKDSSDDNNDIPVEFTDLYNDNELKQVLIDLMHTASDLDILDFKEFCRNIDKPKPACHKTQATTGKHIPVY